MEEWRIMDITEDQVAIITTDITECITTEWATPREMI
jgi:hypothetical protein